MPTFLGLDIGGANIKVANGSGYASSVEFPLWKTPERLADRLRELISVAPQADSLAVTMTGELADCFESKSAGVSFILDAVKDAAGGRTTVVYQTNGRFAPPRQACEDTLMTAASNWHALTAFAARYVVEGTGLLIDIGSTTCDFVPLQAGKPAPHGSNDTDRLLVGELVYTGIERTPVCAVAQNVAYRGQSCPVAGELFATMRDVYLITGDLPEQPKCRDTADGRPATIEAATVRLGRMVCADILQFQLDDARSMAASVAKSQAQQAAAALSRVLGSLSEPPARLILSGHGEFLAHRVLRLVGLAAPQVSLSTEIGPLAARCAAAHAVAVLAREASKG